MNNSEPQISVIVPVYNGEKYICRCIDSILRQTWKDYEIIIIDDGSTDRSGRICDEYQEKYANIIVIHQENQGLATSRKIGVEKSKGKYISFVDADDYITEDYLTTLYMNIEEFDVVSCAYTVVDKHGQRRANTACDTNKEFYDPEEMISLFVQEKYIGASAWGKLVKRDLYLKIDMCEGAVPGEEICTTAQLLRIANGVRVISQPLYFYWQNLEGISHSGYTDRHRKGLENYIKICELLIHEYPQHTENIGAYFCKYEMAIMTAMARNERYEKEVIELLKKQLKKHLRGLLKSSNIEMYYKASALLIILDYRVFSFIFKRIRKYFNR